MRLAELIEVTVSTQPLQRIPQSFIDTLLDRTDIVEVVDSRVKLKRSGRNYSACCPFHKEKTPSFSVQPEKQFYYCFGCGAGGNAISFLMELEHLNFPEAIEELSRRAGLEVPKQDQQLSSQEVARQQIALQARNQALDVLEQTSQYFQTQLRHHAHRQQAVVYLQKRGLSSGIAKRFGIGFAPAGWQNLIEFLSPNNELLEILLANGLVVQKEGNQRIYDFFRERIMFPIRNAKGKVVAFGGRVLGDSKPKYLNSPETDVFHKERELYGLYEARQHERNLTRILVVEGYMDVVALAQHNINYAVATLGTATSQYHLERIFRVVKEVVFCFDGDAAGIKAAIRAMHTCLPFMEDGRQARFLLLPESEDPDSLVRQEGADDFTQRITSATPFSEFLFAHFSQGLDIHQLEHRSQLAMDVWPLIDSMPKGLMKSMMRQRLAKVTGLDEDTMAQLFSVSDVPAVANLTDAVDNNQTNAASTHHASNTNNDDHASYHITEDITENISDNNAAPQDATSPYGAETMPWAPPHDFAPSQQYGAMDARPWLSYRPPFSAASSVLSMAHQAVRMLLQSPEIALDLEVIPKHLQALQQADVQLLVRLMQRSQTMAQALGRSATSAELMTECATINDNDWQVIRNLAAMELLSNEGEHSQQFIAVINKLQLNYVEQCMNELLDQLKAPAAQDEKTALLAQLNTLLQQQKALQNQCK